ncbi:undecaprenyl-diphosphatase [Hydrogenispora ethanolica]|uniref:Undecaprenyl-diphosphatase n=1 Tax=Hydrogenispora ethanolica TaxID=1082276 RepID=A0A4R1QXR6_HYDET|nr:undecaprenyl-diphosphate phosphatase [Hydrogenispora ethanolica]TCL56160.1 undecaprenyl-diphosphatase [Hydrogenispora ethanolica]
MTVFQAFILGLAQGLGEFLPISSSAHLVLLPWILHWPDPGLSFDIALHLGTLLAVVAFFWKEWLILFRHGFSEGLRTREGRMFWFLVVASVPGALIGFIFEKQAETVFRDPALIGCLMIVMGVGLYLADRLGVKRGQSENLNLWQSLLIGLSQGLAILPGVSRSGITMTTGLLVGLDREESARFSFLLSTPIVVGAGLFNLRKLGPDAFTLPFGVGVATSALVGFLVIGLLLRWLRRSSFLPFVWYRLAVGLGVMALWLIRH